MNNNIITHPGTLMRSGLSVRVPRCQKYKWLLNPVWHRMLLYSCTCMATMSVKRLKKRRLMTRNWLLCFRSVVVLDDVVAWNVARLTALCVSHQPPVTVVATTRLIVKVSKYCNRQNKRTKRTAQVVGTYSVATKMSDGRIVNVKHRRVIQCGY